MLRLLTVAVVLAASGGIAAAARLPARQEKPPIRWPSAPQPIPARMLGSSVPVPIPPSILRARNGWLVSDGRTLVAVYAGAAGEDPSTGRLVIVRQDLAAGRQTVKTLDAGHTGALTIAAAPLGRAVETSAQTGSLRVRTTGGRALSLDLERGALRDAHEAPVPSRVQGPRSSDTASYALGR